MNLLEIRNLQIEFCRGSKALRAIDDVSIDVASGETLALVGESGSGKSVTALSIARLVPSPPAVYPSGEILLDGRDVLKMSTSELRSIRGGVVSYVFQEPGASLNPVFRIGHQILEVLRFHRPEATKEAEVVRLLGLVGIPAPEQRIRCYPHELSGGMQQRVAIAIALATQPKMLIADEPTTALDVTVQAQVIELLSDLKRQLGMTILLITHNLGIVGDLADRVAVMYAGQIVELAPTRSLLQRPVHPYTQALMKSAPQLDVQVDRFRTIAGQVPQLGAFPSGCRFHPRCALAKPECSKSAPSLVETENQHWARCPHWREALSLNSQDQKNSL